MAQSFAFDVAQPVQRQAGAQSGAPRIGVSGGQTQGGVVSATPQTDFGESQIPEFLAKAFEPQIQQRQMEQMLKGAADAYSKDAYQDIAREKPGWAKAFGPSAYEKGAANFYANHVALTDYFNKQTARMDEYVKMEPDQVRKELMGGLSEVMTGDPDADLLINKGALDNLGPFMDSYTKARVAYHQELAINNQAAASEAASSLFEQQAKDYDFLKDKPTAETASGYLQATSNFLSVFGNVGQTRESWEKGLERAGYGMLQNKQFRSFNVFKNSQYWSALPADVRDKLEDKASKFEKQANLDAAYGFAPDMLALDARMSQTALFHLLPPKQQAAKLKAGFVPITPAEVLSAKLDINDKIKKLTGASANYFSAEDIKNTASNIFDMQLAGAKQAMSDMKAEAARKQNLEDQLELKRQEAELKAGAAKIAYAGGNLSKAVLDGTIDSGLADGVIRQAWAAGDLSGINTNWANGLPISSFASSVQQQVQSAVGIGPSDNFLSHVRKVAQMRNSGQEGLAMEVYGSWYEKLSTADDLIKGGEDPAIAYDRTFGPKAITAQDAFPGVTWKDRDKITEKLDKAISNVNSGLFGIRAIGGGREANKSAMWAVKQQAMAYLGQKVRGRMPDDKEISGAVNAVISNGSIGLYGRFGWQQRTGSVPLHQAVGVPKTMMDTLLHDYVDAKLKEKKFSGGADGNITEVHWQMYEGQPMLIFLGLDGGTGKETILPVYTKDLKAYAAERGRKKVNEPNFWTGDGEAIGRKMYRSIQSNDPLVKN